MAIDKKHKDFPEYMKKCERLREQMSAELEKIPGSARPALDGDMSKVHRKYSKKLKELQADYRHLFK